MSNPKYLPMQILRDNINVRIKNETDLSALQELFDILKMIEGDALGKPLLEQEYECINQAYQEGIETEDLFKLDNYCEASFIIPKPREILNLAYPPKRQL